MSCSRVPWQCSKGVLAPLLLPTHLPKWELWTWESLYVMTWNVCPFFFLYVCSVELGYKHKRPRPGFKIYTLVSQDGCGGVQFPCVSQLSSQSLLLPVRHVFAWCCCFLLAFAWSHRCSHLAYLWWYSVSVSVVGCSCLMKTWMQVAQGCCRPKCLSI